MTRIASLLTLIALAFPVFAQSAPDGNAHPDLAPVGEVSDQDTNPFGAPVPTTSTAADKKAFQDQLDLSPLAGLAVSHQGRVKIVETLALEAVETITRRNRHFDLINADDVSGYAGGTVEKVRFDPVFTWLDTMIDPGHYIDRPTIGVGYLPLRQQILFKAVSDPELRNGWLKMGMVSPRMVDAHLNAVLDEHSGEEQYISAARKVDTSFFVFLSGWQNLAMVAPTSEDQPWTHVSRLPADSPVRAAFAQLGEAWRAGDAASANIAIATIAEELPKINPEIYPAGRRSLESLYNRSNAFEWGYWVYLISLVALILAFGTGRKWLAAFGIVALVVAMGLHGFGFGLRWAIAERFPIQNQFESMTGISLFAAIVGFVVMLARKQWLYGAAASATGFLILITATQTGIPGQTIEREAAILNTSVLLKYHVTTVLTSYGLITLGFIISLFYLATHYGHRIFGGAKVAAGTDAGVVAAGALGYDDAGKAGLSKTLKDLDTAQMTVLQLAFWTLGVGTLLGAWWADHSWGRWWAFDPKETWALVTWIVYLIVIHVRFTNLKDRGLTTAWLSVIGFFVMLWTYFGVNLLLPGLHAYA